MSTAKEPVVAGLGVLVGLLAARRLRRPATSEVARDELAEEQAALRRVATLVAHGVSSDEVFTAVAAEVGRLLRADCAYVIRYDADAEVTRLQAWSAPGDPLSSVGCRTLVAEWLTAEVLRTGEVVRFDDVEGPRELSDGADDQSLMAMGAPIEVEGRLWGAIIVGCAHRRLPAGAAERLAAFTELAATAISNSASRAELARLADEQAALRRVATLVAHGVPPPELFAAVAREVGQLLDVDATHMARYDPDGSAVAIAAWSPTAAHVEVGTRATLDDKSVTGRVHLTGRPARIHGYEGATGGVAAIGRELGMHASVGAPIVVDKRLWGVIVASTKRDEELPVYAESRIAAFTELVATAISNTEARALLGELADEQAALRRVATLVASQKPTSELFSAIMAELGHLLGADLGGMIRYESADTVATIATWAAVGEHPPAPDVLPMVEGDPAWLVATSRRTERIDDWGPVPGPLSAYIRTLGISSSVGCPIIVDGQLWGAAAVHYIDPEAVPAEIEARVASFTDLVATAMSNSRAHAEVRRLADEQAALRRVATLVAMESPPDAIFAAVVEEVGRVLSIEFTMLFRYESDGTATLVAEQGGIFPVTTRVGSEDDGLVARVRRSERPARVDDYSTVASPLGMHACEGQIRSSVASPVVVGGRIWGVIVASTQRAEPLPADAESRMGEFTELVATAISNIQARSDLAASRARIAASADEERRRVVRDLHDGGQQRLVHTVITLKLARQALSIGGEDAPALVEQALDNAQRATEELRELAQGILPAVLTRGGLRAGINSLAERMPLPVETRVSVGPLPAAVEATAYFVVSEALTNVAKHAGARRAEVSARVEDQTLHIEIRDDGHGGAQAGGSGLVGLADRVAVLDGHLRVDSPAGGGTLISVAIPVATG